MAAWTARANLLRAAILALLALGALWALWPARLPAPALIAGLADEGLRGAPCPARTLYEQDARRKHGPRAASALTVRLQEKFPLASPVADLRKTLEDQGFAPFTPCANDEGVFGLRWLSRDWGAPNAYVYWREDFDGRLSFLDGHVSKSD
jgi:hypothetical protein